MSNIGNVTDKFSHSGFGTEAERLELVASGKVPGIKLHTVLGTKQDTIGPPFTTVWEGPTAVYVFPTVVGTLSIRSGNVADSAVGTGVRSVRIEWLDANYDERVSETLTSGGPLILPGSPQFWRIQKITALTVGSNGSAVSNIDVEDNLGGVVYARIRPSYSESRMCICTVPRSMKAIVRSVLVQTSSSTGFWRLRSHDHNKTSGIPLLLNAGKSGNVGSSEVFRVFEKNDIMLETHRISVGGVTIGAFTIELVSVALL